MKLISALHRPYTRSHWLIKATRKTDDWQWHKKQQQQQKLVQTLEMQSGGYIRLRLPIAILSPCPSFRCDFICALFVLQYIGDNTNSHIVTRADSTIYSHFIVGIANECGVSSNRRHDTSSMRLFAADCRAPALFFCAFLHTFHCRSDFAWSTEFAKVIS